MPGYLHECRSPGQSMGGARGLQGGGQTQLRLLWVVLMSGIACTPLSLTYIYINNINKKYLSLNVFKDHTFI